MLHLSCERVFDDSCSHVPVMSCIFFFIKDDMHAEVSQACQVFDTDVTQVQLPK